MPYVLSKHPTKKGKYVVRKKSGKIVAGNKTPLSKARATAAMRARYHAESGKPFTKTKK